MQVHEIAKATGFENERIAADLGVEAGKGIALRKVDDSVALEYIARSGGVLPEEPKGSGVARFWSTKRAYFIPASDGRGDIQFKDWVFSCPDDSAEAGFIRERRDYFIAQGAYEVIPHPHKDPMMVADFASALLGCIYTGARGDSTPSREGRDCVKALLATDVSAGLTSEQKNTPRLLVRKAAELVSLNVDNYQEKL